MMDRPKEIPERIWEKICHKGFNKRKIPHILKMESSTRILFQTIECIAQVEYRFDVRSMTKLNNYSLHSKHKDVLEYALRCFKPFPKYTVYQLGIHYLEKDTFSCMNMAVLLVNQTNIVSYRYGMKLLQALSQEPSHTIN
jgi:hypothetical protein